MLDNDTLLKSYHYLLATMMVVMLLVVYQVFFVHRPVCKTVQRLLGEGMTPPRYNNWEHSGLTDRGPPGVSGFDLSGGGEGFLSSYEPPVFRPMGNVDDVMSTRGRAGYKVVDGKLYDDAGNAVTESLTNWKQNEGMGNRDHTSRTISDLEANPY